MKTIMFFLFIFGAAILADGQQDTLLVKYEPGGNEYQNLTTYLKTWNDASLNKLDSAGKKNGKWIVYMDVRWKVITDSNKAVFYKYTYFDHGLNIYNNQTSARKEWKLIEPLGRNSQQNKGIKLLDGEYKWVDKNGAVTWTNIFKNGIPILMLDFDPDNKLQGDCWNYLKHYRNQPLSFFVSISDKNGSLKNYYFSEIVNSEGEVVTPAKWGLFPYESSK